MKINPYGTQGINPYKRNMNKLDQAGKTTGKTTDKVEISSEAIEMQQQVNQTTAERQSKIDEIKLQVENGTYKVDPKTVAKSIINFYSKH
jgi:negative regulator of flagellin synthesis FlgM